MSELTDWCRTEAARNAQMQGDKGHQTNRRRKTFRYRNHMLTAAADRIAELENQNKHVLEMEVIALESLKIIERLEAQRKQVEVLPDQFLGILIEKAKKRFYGSEFLAVKATLEGCAQVLKKALEQP